MYINARFRVYRGGVCERNLDQDLKGVGEKEKKCFFSSLVHSMLYIFIV